jgi:phosphoadenosine phosphosulfate reductase
MKMAADSICPAAGPVTQETPEARVARLNALYRGATPKEILYAAIAEFGDGLAAVSSFGAEAAITLHLLSELKRSTPVLFLETGMHFAQTLQYRDDLIARLGLTGVRNIAPDPVDVATLDPQGALWRTSTDACCDIRKVKPLDSVLRPEFSAWITGRKRMHGGARLRLPVFEYDAPNGKYKVNPLASFTQEDVDAYFRAHELPPHPLVAEGYRSIGCWPCTQPSEDSADARSGRWAGQEKTECGIHLQRDAWSSLDSSEL